MASISLSKFALSLSAWSNRHVYLSFDPRVQTNLTSNLCCYRTYTYPFATTSNFISGNSGIGLHSSLNDLWLGIESPQVNIIYKIEDSCLMAIVTCYHFSVKQWIDKPGVWMAVMVHSHSQRPIPTETNIMNKYTEPNGNLRCHLCKQECLSALCCASFVDVYLAYLKSYGHLKIIKCIGMY